MDSQQPPSDLWELSDRQRHWQQRDRDAISEFEPEALPRSHVPRRAELVRRLVYLGLIAFFAMSLIHKF